jgi:hypothetical protein
MKNMRKFDFLQEAQQARIEEIEHYQLNIDNYRLALKLLDDRQDTDMVGFKAQLEELLHTSIIEQKKAQIMLDVITIQLETLV